MNTSLSSRIVLVTGVTSGIGHALTRQLLAAGATVWGLGRNAAKLDAMAEALGPAFRPLTADLADPADRQRVSERLRGSDEPLHAFVSNAAECVYDTPLELPTDRLRTLFETNVFAAIELAQAVVPLMSRGSHLVQLSSVTARFVANAKFAPYAASKRAIAELTEALRWELHPRGIHVSLIVPGLVDTPIYDQVPGFARTRSKIEEQVPEWLQPEDVADAIMWVLTRPDHLVVSELTLLPRQQTR